jgi:hypothetical protein
MAMATAPASAEAPMIDFCDMLISLKMILNRYRVLFLFRQGDHDKMPHHLEIKRTLSDITCL